MSEREKLLKHVQIALCKALFGDYEACGYDQKIACWSAAHAALAAMEAHGWDLFVVPNGSQVC